MKKLLLSAVAMLMVTMSYAQELMKVQLADGSVREFNVADVTRVYFEEKTAPEVAPADFTQPITTWGISAAAVKTQMAAAGFELEEERSGALYYNGKKKELMVGYYFDEANTLIESYVFLSATDVTAEAVEANILQNHTFVNNYNDSTKLYVSADRATLVFFTEETDEGETYYSVEYVSYEYLMRNSVYFTEPYLIWGTDREAVRAVLEERGYELYREYGAENDWALIYEGNDQEGLIYYWFDANKKLEDVMLVFEGITVDEMKDFMTDELGYTYDGQRTLKLNDGSSLLVSDFTTADEQSYVIMYERSFDDPEYGQYTLLYLEFYSAADDEAKARTGNGTSRLNDNVHKFNVSFSEMRTFKLRNISKLKRINK